MRLKTFKSKKLFDKKQKQMIHLKDTFEMLNEILNYKFTCQTEIKKEKILLFVPSPYVVVPFQETK